MKLAIGLRGDADQASAITIKIDGLTLEPSPPLSYPRIKGTMIRLFLTADYLFLRRDERINTGRNIVAFIDSLSKEHEIEMGEDLIPQIESELHIEKGTLNKYGT